MINAYRKLGMCLFEVRMTQSQRGEEAKEILRGPNMLGANKKRAVKAIKRAEKAGPKPLSHERIRSADRGGVTNSRILKLPTTAGVRKVAGLTALQVRAVKQRGLRGGVQNIPKLAKDMKKDPSTIPPIVTSKKDKPGNGGRRVADKEAIEGGRSRAATALAINKEPDAVTVPQDRHTGSAKRYAKARLSGKLKGKENLPGQDPRLQKMSDDDLKKLKFEQRNVYRKIGIILAEEPDPKHWNSWYLDPKNPKKGKLYSQKAGSQEVEGGNTPVPVKKRRTRVTTPADDLGIEGTKTHHTTTSNAVTTTDKKTGAWHTAVRTMDGTPLRIKRSTSVKGKIKNDDGTTQQVNVKDFPTSHSSRK